MKLGNLLRVGAVSAVAMLAATPCIAAAKSVNGFSPVPGSPYQVNGGSEYSVAISLSDRLVASGGYFTGVNVFSLQRGTDALNPVTSLLSPAALPLSLSFDASGKLLAVANPGSGVEIFSVAKAGRIIQVRLLSDLSTSDGITDDPTSSWRSAPRATYSRSATPQTTTWRWRRSIRRPVRLSPSATCPPVRA
jgi:hypothetical protein